jgi:membrane associated rhomboid family serine protease
MFPLYDNNPIQRTPVVTYALVAINVLVFLWASRLPDPQQQVLAYRYGFVPARIVQLSRHQDLPVPVDVVVQSRFWGPQLVRQEIILKSEPRQIWLSLLTCMFLHGSWWHLLGNMWFLWLFGDNVEDRLGPPVGQYVVLVAVRQQRGRPVAAVVVRVPLCARRPVGQRGPLVGQP